MPITSSEPLHIHISSFDVVPHLRSPILNRGSSPGQLAPIQHPGVGAHSYHNPLTTPLDELVQQQGQVLQDKPADVEGKELGSVPSAELEADLRLVCMPEPRILHLAGNLV